MRLYQFTGSFAYTLSILILNLLSAEIIIDILYQVSSDVRGFPETLH